MKKEELINLKNKILKLSKEEQKLRDLYLKKLSNGTYQGPLVEYPEIDKPWLQYQTDEAILKDFEGVSAYQLMQKSNVGHENEVAIEYFGRKITFKELMNNIDLVAKGLTEIGIKKGDVVMMSMPNTPEAEYLFYAINKIGAVLNTIDPRTSPEIIINDAIKTNTKYVFGIDALSKVLEKMPENIKGVAISPYTSLPLPLKIMMKLKGDPNKNSQVLSWDNFINMSKQSNIKETTSIYEPNSLAAIVHTGGTTGIPKGVMLTNENLNGLIYQMKYGYDNFHRGQTFLNILPPFIALGLNNAMHLSACLGLKSVMIPTFEPEDIPGLLLKHKPNIFLCGPIHLKVLLKDKNVKNKDLSFIEVICSGGEKMPEKDQEEAQSFLEEHGSSAKMWLGYGATEMSAGISCMKDNAFIYKSVGVPYLQNNIKICDIDTKEELQGYNQTGEVYISGPTLMQDYILSEEYKESEEVIVTDECGTKWYKSKDIGRVNEDGMLFIDDRLKRIITRRGFKIYPEHIESIIRQNEYVEDCVVVGIYDEDEISIPVANIVLKEEVKYNEDVKQSIIENTEEIIKASLPSYTVIAGYNFIDKMPLTKIGKTDFVALEKLGIMGEKRNQKIFKMM